jgi:hypothetical protein
MLGNLDAEGLFWALLFGLPVAVGVALAAGRSVNAPPTIPLAVTMGAVAGIAVFLVVAVAQATNPDEDPEAAPGPDATAETTTDAESDS